MLEGEVNTIEREAIRTTHVADKRVLNLQEKYSRLTLEPSFLDQVRARIRHDTDVWFNYSSAARFTLGSSILNRVLVATLTRLGAITPKLAQLDDKAVSRLTNGEYAVTWPQTLLPQVFDRIVMRHGPPQDYLAEVFPKLSVPCAPLRGKLRDLDLTRFLDNSTRVYFGR